MSVTAPIAAAVQQLRRFPGVGEKTATRLVYWVLRSPPGTASEIAAALAALDGQVRECEVCRDFTSEARCALCANPRRDDAQLCVVEQPTDVLAFERAGEYRGRYHVLHGAISPLDGVGPDQLRIRPLLERLRDARVTEVILAMDSDVEGDATALYLAKLLKPLGIKVTRLAHGISIGTEIEYVDAVTLSRAFQNRQEV